MFVAPSSVSLGWPSRVVALPIVLCALASGIAAADEPAPPADTPLATATDVPTGVLRLDEAPAPPLPESESQPTRPRRSLRAVPQASDFTDVVNVVNDDGTVRRVTTMFGKPIDGQSLEPWRAPPDAPPRAKLSARTPDDDAAPVPAAQPVDDGKGWFVAGAIGACLVLGIVVLVMRK